MIRPAWLCFLAVLIVVPGCAPPGKPKPLPDEGLPRKTMAFEALYAANCAGCHGKDGNLGAAPPLADSLFLNIVSVAELSQAIADGRPGTPMPPFAKSKGGPLDPPQVQALAAGLVQKWKNAAGPANLPPYRAAFHGDASRGAKIYVSACGGCHGSDGREGRFDGRTIGAIDDAAYLALCSDQLLRRYVITGRPDLGMPNYQEPTGRPASFKPLTDQAVSDLTALLVSWRKPAAKP